MSSKTALDTRANLIAAARHMLAENGFEGTTMRALADAAGVKQPIIYYYFEGKDSLLEAAFLAIRQDIRSALTALPPARSSGELMRQRIMFHLDNAPLIMGMLNYFMAKKRRGTGGEGSAIPARAYGHILEAIERGMAEGKYYSAMPARDAGIIVHALNGFAIEHFPVHAASTDATLVDDFLNFAERALSPLSQTNQQKGSL